MPSADATINKQLRVLEALELPGKSGLVFRPNTPAERRLAAVVGVNGFDCRSTGEERCFAVDEQTFTADKATTREGWLTTVAQHRKAGHGYERHLLEHAVLLTLPFGSFAAVVRAGAKRTFHSDSCVDGYPAWRSSGTKGASIELLLRPRALRWLELQMHTPLVALGAPRWPPSHAALWSVGFALQGEALAAAWRGWLPRLASCPAALPPSRSGYTSVHYKPTALALGAHCAALASLPTNTQHSETRATTRQI